MSQILMHDIPNHERPRERLEKYNAEILSDAELLAIILGTGSLGISTIDLSRILLNTFGGSLNNVYKASFFELSKVKGIGKAKIASIKAAFALGLRLKSENKSEIYKVKDPASVADYMRFIFKGKTQEEFHILLLDTKHQIIRNFMVTKGLLDRSPVHSREVFREAIKEETSKIILVHNHPSGDPTPSIQDIKCTENLYEAGKILGIEVMDHIIIGSKSINHKKDYVSLRNAGLFPNKPA